MSREKRERKKEKKARWKAYKRERKKLRRQERLRMKEEYADAPFLTRFFHVNGSRLKKLVAVIIVLCLLPVAGSAVANSALVYSLELLLAHAVLDKMDQIEVIQEEIYELSPQDAEGSARIDALPENNPDDSWTFCVYMVGSNLEDLGENDLSDYVWNVVAPVAAQNRSKRSQDFYSRMGQYTGELLDNGLDLPNYIYGVSQPVERHDIVTSDVIVTDEQGCASADMDEMMEYALPDNITIVVQTGGARRWSNTLVNPNRTQRFVIQNGLIREEENLHLQDSCSPDTLADFISYCKENFASDHMAMIFWDHGGGISGYGSDMIYGTSMSLADLGAAMEKSIEKNNETPYFDIIGFDACLMACPDIARVFDGYGKYLVASEETEPGDGWDYAVWLKELADQPSMNGAQVGRAIADSYMDYYVRDNIKMSLLDKELAVTFSVVDIATAVKLDNAFEAMNREFLKKIAGDPSVLTDMSRAAKSTIRYAAADCNYFNLIDLGVYLDNLSARYPEETAPVQELLQEAVLYKRSNSILSDSQGLAVYFPATVDSLDSMVLFTDYVYNISDKKYTNALYYYKVAGCLNEELDTLVTGLTGKQLPVLDSGLFYRYQKLLPVIGNGNIFRISAGTELTDRIQDVYVETARYDENEGTITYYGTDEDCRILGNGVITGVVNGQGFALDGSPLDAKFSFRTGDTSTYVAKVLHNDVPSYMTFSLDEATKEVVINSMVKIPDERDYNMDMALRVTTEVLPGDVIIPLLTQQTSNGSHSEDINGKKITYTENSSIQQTALADGIYVQTVVISDLRGDRYYSPVMSFEMKNGKVSNLMLDPSFIGKE